MNERVFNQKIEKLRAPERKEKMQADLVVELITKDDNTKSLLDIGTGSGVFAELFSKQGIDVTGVDINPEMIEAARHYLPKLNFKTAAAEKLPFNDNEFDVSFFGVVFHEVDDYVKALKEAARVSKNYVYIFEWKFVSEESGPPLEHRLNSSHILKFAADAGLKNVNSTELKSHVLYKLS